MPRKDPITGCQVMTFPEFLTAEGEREGKSGGEVLEDMYKQMAEDDEQSSQQLRDPAVALPILQEAALRLAEAWDDDRVSVEDDPFAIITLKDEQSGEWVSALKIHADVDPIPPFPLDIVEVLEAKSHGGFSESKTMIKARCLCHDGQEHTLQFSSVSSYGSFYEPPDYDEELSYLN